MKITSGNFVLSIVSRALGYIDGRLTGHGERVAYLCEKMLETGGVTDNIDKKEMLILAMLHDIGAYKTEDIDKMVEFETVDVSRHAIYGYLFLKNRSALGHLAEAVLYHHTHYEKYGDISSGQLRAAALIHICDRADILCELKSNNVTEEIEKKSGTVFDPLLVSQFKECCDKYKATDKLRSGEWEEEFEEMKNSVSVTEEESVEFIRMLVYAIDFRSECTVTHTSATVEYAKDLAIAAGLSGEETEELVLAAFLHDIGKIATPVEILEKPGRLTDEEMKTMREHIVYSEKILRGIVPDVITDIAVRHHERPNGKGYPHGLSSGDLTKRQRILACADVMSALAGKRSYKVPFTKEQTVNIISAMAKKGDLDADICSVLINNYDSIHEKAEKAVLKTEQTYERIKKEYSELLSVV